eukprot:m.208503 g.208503  ORF g.208503 m.208503 type:complete len:165 (+) comp16926_c1_seq4:146-640(+)
MVKWAFDIAGVCFCLGRRFLLHRGKKDWEMSYHSGGAGYVLSRRALQLLGERAEHVFRKSGVAEDVEIARSLQALGIQCEDTRDETGRETFLPLNIQRLRYEISKEQKPDFWYWRYAYYPARDGLVSCGLFSLATWVFMLDWLRDWRTCCLVACVVSNSPTCDI